MTNTLNTSTGASNRLNYIYSLINEALALTADVDLDECNYFVHTSTNEKPSQIHLELPCIGDERCYCPCTKCKGIKRRRINMSTTRKHCYEHGHLEGGNKYYPSVR